MKKLEIKLFRYGNVLFGRVVHMDESLIGKGELAKDGTLKIKSDTHPDIIGGSLYVNGTYEEFDGQCLTACYPNEEYEIDVSKRYKAMIDRINEEAVTEVIRVI